MDEAQAAHADPGGVEEAIVLHQAAIGVTGRVALGIGGPVGRLDPVDGAAARDQIEGAHEVADRSEPDP